jgi:hypothetical protein
MSNNFAKVSKILLLLNTRMMNFKIVLVFLGHPLYGLVTNNNMFLLCAVSDVLNNMTSSKNFSLDCLILELFIRVWHIVALYNLFITCRKQICMIMLLYRCWQMKIKNDVSFFPYHYTTTKYAFIYMIHTK